MANESATERAYKRLRSLQGHRADVAHSDHGEPWKIEARQTLEAYLAMNARVPDVASDPLAWYAAPGSPGHASVNESRYLGPLARRYLAIPVSNHRVERLWATARNLLEYSRRNLDGATVSTTIKLHHNSEALDMWPVKPLSLKGALGRA